MNCKFLFNTKQINIKEKYIALKFIVILFITILLNISLYSQDIKKDITIVKPYQPTVQDFYKISLLPVFRDTDITPISYNYQINTLKINAPYQPRPVPMAKMASETVEEIFNNYLRFGIGNPWSPILEASFNNGRSKDKQLGITFKHYSAKGSVFIEDTRNKIDAPFNHNSLDIYGKQLMKKLTFAGKINYTAEKYNFYGIHPLSAPLLPTDSFTQKLQKGNINIQVFSTTNDSNKFLYTVNGNFQYFQDNYNNNENTIFFKSSIGRNVKEFFAGAEIVNMYSMADINKDISKINMFTLKPYLIKSKNEWKLTLGLQLTVEKNDSSSIIYPFPFGCFEFTILPRILKASLTYEGFVAANTYSNLVQKNPYIKPGLSGKTTHSNSAVTFKLSGSITNSANYSISAYYQNIDNQMFYVNSVDSPFYNKFISLYDDVEKIGFAAHLYYVISEKLRFEIGGNYNNISTIRLLKPWNEPAIKADASVKYNLHNKIISTSKIYFIGPRHALEPITSEVKTLPAFIDINQKIEYQYTRKFSILLELNNITASQYQYWNQYNHYRLQIRLGALFLF